MRDTGDGTAYKVDGVRGGVYVGQAGDVRGTNRLDADGDAKARSALDAYRAEGVVGVTEGFSDVGLATAPAPSPPAAAPPPPQSAEDKTASTTREALGFFFSDDGQVFRDFLVEEVVAAADALSREAANELAVALSPIGLSPLGGAFAPPAVAPLFKALAPKLTDADRKVVTSIRELVAFFLGDLTTTAELSTVNGGALRNPEQLRTLQALLPVLRENQAELRAFGLQIVGRLAERQAARALGYVRDQVGVDRARSL